MRISDLIVALQKIRVDYGNVEVIFGSFSGTNNQHITFNVTPFDVDNFYTSGKMTGDGRCSLSIEPDKEAIMKSIKIMESAGYKYYRSQFVGPGEQPKEGLSPCSWHYVQ